MCVKHACHTVPKSSEFSTHAQTLTVILSTFSITFQFCNISLPAVGSFLCPLGGFEFSPLFQCVWCTDSLSGQRNLDVFLQIMGSKAMTFSRFCGSSMALHWALVCSHHRSLQWFLINFSVIFTICTQLFKVILSHGQCTQENVPYVSYEVWLPSR